MTYSHSWCNGYSLCNTNGIKVGGKVIDHTSRTFNNILDPIKQANDIPPWAKGEKTKPGESSKDFAKRLCDENGEIAILYKWRERYEG